MLALLGAAAFPIYWMLVTSLTPSAELFAQHAPPAAQAGPIAGLPDCLLAEAGRHLAAEQRDRRHRHDRRLSIAWPCFRRTRCRASVFAARALLGFGLFATQMLPEAMLVVPLYAIFGQLCAAQHA